MENSNETAPVVEETKAATQSSENDLPIAKDGNLKMIALSVVTLGLYTLYWLYKRYDSFNTLIEYENVPFPKSTVIGYIAWYVAVLFLSFNPYTSTNFIVTVVQYFTVIINVMFAYYMISGIEKYSMQKYGKSPKFNVLACILFSFMYVNYEINKFPERLAKISED